MPESIFHRLRPSSALIWICAAAACAACHPSPGQARIALPSGPVLEVPGEQQPLPSAPAPAPPPPEPAAFTASCGGPKIFHVVARAASVDDHENRGWPTDSRYPWHFRAVELAGRTVVTACIEPLPQGCVQTHLAELADGRWAEAAVPTTGLPPLTVVNLLTAPGTPFRHAIHEENPPFDGDPQDVCDYFNMMEGTVSLEGLYGEWPDNAWAEVTFALDHSGNPYDDLYRWDGTRWTQRYSPKRLETYVETAVPWRGGLAAVAVADAADVLQRKIVYLGPGREWRELLSRIRADLRVGIVGGALVAVTNETGRADTEEIRVRRWATPQARPAAQALDVPQGDQILWVTVGDEAVTVHLVRDGGARVDDVWRFDGRWALRERRELAEGDESGGADESGDPIECRDLALGGTALDIRSEWRLAGRFLIEVEAPVAGETWLLSDRPVERAWEIPTEPLIWPPRPQCPPGEIPEGSLGAGGFSEF